MNVLGKAAWSKKIGAQVILAFLAVLLSPSAADAGKPYLRSLGPAALAFFTPPPLDFTALRALPPLSTGNETNRVSQDTSTAAITFKATAGGVEEVRAGPTNAIVIQSGPVPLGPPPLVNADTLSQLYISLPGTNTVPLISMPMTFAPPQISETRSSSATYIIKP